MTKQERGPIIVTVILLLTHRGIGGRISACNGQSFGDMLCEAGQVVRVTEVFLASDERLQGCYGYREGCEVPVHSTKPYYKEVTDACDGRMTCYLHARPHDINCYGNTFPSTYTSIEYDCDSTTEIKSSSRCWDHPFNDVTCSVVGALEVISIFVGKQTSSKCENGRYNITQDCLRSLDSVSPMDNIDLKSKCESHRGCTADRSQRYCVHKNRECPQSYTTDYTLIFYRCKAFREVSRCHDEKFDTMMCQPGTVVNIISVNASNMNNLDGCSGVYAGHTVSVPPEYCRQIKSSCEGRLGCVNVTSKEIELKSIWPWRDSSKYIQIKYDCVDEFHTEHHTSKDVGEAFDAVMCTPGTVIDIKMVLVSAELMRTEGRPSERCSVRVPPNDDYFVETKEACDRKLACVGVKSREYTMNCGYESVTSSRTTLVYHCLSEDPKGIRYIHRCAGSRFPRVTCPAEQQLQVVNIFVGQLKHGGPGCVNDQYDLTEDCLVTLDSVHEDDYIKLRDSCQMEGCPEQDSFAQQTTRCSTARIQNWTNYTLVAYTCKHDIRYVSLCKESAFTEVRCPLNQSLEMINIFLGQKEQTSQCPDGQSLDAVVHAGCQVTLNSVPGFNYREFVNACESADGCGDKKFEPQNHHISCGRPDYMLFVFRCRHLSIHPTTPMTTRHCTTALVSGARETTTGRDTTVAHSPWEDETLQPTSGHQEQRGALHIGLTAALPLVCSVCLVVVVISVCVVRRQKTKNRRNSNVPTDVQMDIVQQRDQSVYTLATEPGAAPCRPGDSSGSVAADTANGYCDMPLSGDGTRPEEHVTGDDVYSMVDKSHKTRPTGANSAHPSNMSDSDLDEPEDTILVDNSLYGHY